MVGVPAGSVNQHGDLDCLWRCRARLLRPDFCGTGFSVEFQDILYTVLSPHPLQLGALTQRSTAVDRWVTRSSSRTTLRQ
jgi:hypothetical protein